MVPSFLLSLMMLNGCVEAAQLLSEARVQSQTALESQIASQEGALSTAGIEELLKLKFAEPLPVVMARAKKNSNTLPLKEALKKVHHTLPSEVHMFIEQDNSTHALVKSSTGASSHFGLGNLHQSAVFDKAMAFMNEQVKIAREKMDIKLFECGFFKLEKEGLLYRTQDTLDSIAQGISLAESTIEKCQGEIAALSITLSEKRGELAEHLAWCAKIRAELEAEKAIIEEDLRVIDLIKDTTVKECSAKISGLPTKLLIQACVSADGKTEFQTTSSLIEEQADQFKSVSAQNAFQMVLFEVYGGLGAALPGKVDLMGLTGADTDTSDEDDVGYDDEVPAQSFIQTKNKLQELRSVGGPSAPTKNKAPAKLRGRKCPIGAAGNNPNCPKLLDKIDQIRGEIIDQLTQKTKELEAHNTYCKGITDGLNTEIQILINQLTVWNVELAKATGQLGGLQISQREYMAIKHQVCKELREKYTECYKDLTALELEICGLLKIRQSVYNRVKAPDLKPGDPQIIIQDCEMGDWVVGPCSSTCVDAQGRAGVQLITRSPAIKWDPSTPEGKYGMSCPPSMVSRDCSYIPCPIDCVMADWSTWSKCSKDCGGGQQGRSRGIEQEAEHGGKECPGNSQEQLCNTGSCDVDCVLTDWTGWGPCSKSCRWRSTARPGRQRRSKSIKVASKGGGKCPKPRSRKRYQWQKCNNFVCPKNIKCVADVDVIVLLDGSGSLWYRYGPKDRNWELTKKFTTDLISFSKMATMDDQGKAKGGVRYGAAMFSWGVTMISPITCKKDEIIDKVKAASWPRGWTMTDLGLLQAKAMFQIQGTVNRQQIIVVVTDGKASNRWKARKAAKEVRKAGMRIILVPVGRAAMKQEKEMCRWASKPCNENMIKTRNFKMLISKLRWYLTTLCPIISSE